MNRRAIVLFAVQALVAVPLHAADDPLARARALYNQHQFDAAVSEAEKARVIPSRADAADLIAARAYLERFRQSAASDDLTNGRERLRRLDPQHLDSRERLEYVVGLGETLYLDGEYGAAASIFDSILLGPDVLTVARERVLAWWADALDRDTRQRLATSTGIDRSTTYRRIRARMEDELASHPANAKAAYWLAASARAQGELQDAWDAAEAAWARAPLAADGGDALRDDLDRLMTKGIIPERAKATSQPPAMLVADWERFKDRWKPAR